MEISTILGTIEFIDREQGKNNEILRRSRKHVTFPWEPPRYVLTSRWLTEDQERKLRKTNISYDDIIITYELKNFKFSCSVSISLQLNLTLKVNQN